MTPWIGGVFCSIGVPGERTHNGAMGTPAQQPTVENHFSIRGLDRQLLERAKHCPPRTAVNAGLHALAQANREIANYTRAIARADFTSLDPALGAAEHRRATLQAEVVRPDGSQQRAVIQLTPAALERHLQGMTEKLRSGVNGKVREAIQQSVDRILVGVDGSLTAKRSRGFLGLEGHNAQVGDREHPTLLVPATCSATRRQ